MHFNYAKFDYACFIVAEFNRGADFHRAKLDKADFRAASFKKVANFWGTLFKVVDFEMAKFEDFTVFEESTLEWAKFKDISFKGAADFTDVVFKLLIFIRTMFEDIAMFKLKDLEELENELEETRAQAGYCHICEQYECKMELERLEKRRELLRDESRFAVFNLVAFKHPENVWFIDFPLSNTSFLLTDISKTMMIANFDGKTLSDKLLEKPQKCDECTRKCEIRYMKRDHILNMFIDIKHTLPEGEALKILQPHLKQETVLAEYRNLRKAFENSRTYQEASNLFVKEMKLLGESLKCDTPSIRRQLEVGIEKLFHTIYGRIFSYGESVFLPVLLMLVIIIGIPVLLSLIFDAKFSNLFVNVTANFFQIPRELGGCEIPVRILGAITLGLLFIAFRRRFERK
ncbi:MAG: pentapeptide repeat-containing protein [Archaeoglobaceae archaeon]|nr:pentapeptide repeat-containing protein [Archaeoglobaceae archaeon]